MASPGRHCQSVFLVCVAIRLAGRTDVDVFLGYVAEVLLAKAFSSVALFRATRDRFAGCFDCKRSWNANTSAAYLQNTSMRQRLHLQLLDFIFGLRTPLVAIILGPGLVNLRTELRA